MAAIYSQDGHPVALGLQGCNVCDEAIQIARSHAKETGEPVTLEDDDGTWLVHPNGDCDDISPNELSYDAFVAAYEAAMDESGEAAYDERRRLQKENPEHYAAWLDS